MTDLFKNGLLFSAILMLLAGCSHKPVLVLSGQDGLTDSHHAWIPYGSSDVGIGDQVLVHPLLCRTTTMLNLRHRPTEVCDPGPTTVAEVVKANGDRALIKLPDGLDSKTQKIAIDQILRK